MEFTWLADSTRCRPLFVVHSTALIKAEGQWAGQPIIWFLYKPREWSTTLTKSNLSILWLVAIMQKFCRRFTDEDAKLNSSNHNIMVIGIAPLMSAIADTESETKDSDQYYVSAERSNYVVQLCMST